MYGAYLVTRFLFWAIPAPGWTSVMVSLYFLTGLLFANVGIIGLYLGEVFSEAKGRPLYLVQDATESWFETASVQPTDASEERSPAREVVE